LSDLTEVRSQIREDFSEELARVHLLHGGHAAASGYRSAPSAAIQIALTSLGQCITCCQASVLLCEGGMPICSLRTKDWI
jgi:hypothetical protein